MKDSRKHPSISPSFLHDTGLSKLFYQTVRKINREHSPVWVPDDTGPLIDGNRHDGHGGNDFHISCGPDNLGKLHKTST